MAALPAALRSWNNNVGELNSNYFTPKFGSVPYQQPPTWNAQTGQYDPLPGAQPSAPTQPAPTQPRAPTQPNTGGGNGATWNGGGLGNAAAAAQPSIPRPQGQVWQTAGPAWVNAQAQAQPANATQARNATGGPALQTNAPGVQFGNADWVNPMYNPTQNDNGYTRFDYKQQGSGLERARTYADGARIFDGYNKLEQGKPGYTHAENARQYLQSTYGVTPERASDVQKFAAMDAAMRGAQGKNQLPPRHFGIGNLLSPILGAVGSFLLPGVGSYLGSALGTAINGGSISDIASGAAKNIVGDWAGPAFSFK